ncbi:MAG: TetR/AcrR family transcriptional regulator, partial [Pseudomonadales bacterium]
MSTGNKAKLSQKTDEENREISWQAQKSAMTRDRILDAAIECFINLGYTNVTTAKVASAAGVSRGAMLHHFPSKADLIQATVEYLHGKLLEDYTNRVKNIPTRLRGRRRRRAGLEAYWQYLTSELFVAYHELCIASRTNKELKDILQALSVEFDRHGYELSFELFSEWHDRAERFELAMDVSKFMMEGMAVGQLVVNREERIKKLLDYLADRLEEIFQDRESSSAIGRHS